MSKIQNDEVVFIDPLSDFGFKRFPGRTQQVAADLIPKRGFSRKKNNPGSGLQQERTVVNSVFPIIAKMLMTSS